MQCQCFIELEEFNDLARYFYALRDYLLRVYSLEFEGRRIIASTLMLANTFGNILCEYGKTRKIHIT